MARPNLLDLLETEMRLERSSALARVGEKLQRAIDETNRLGAQLDLVGPGPERARLLERYAESRRVAEEQHYYLIVQREAIGMLEHAIVDEIYPLPPIRRR